VKPELAMIWAGALLAAVGSFLPNLFAWLSRALDASRRIERYSAEILASADGIVANTAAASALKATGAAAPSLLASAESLGRHTQAIGTALGAPASGEGAKEEGEK
jgi:hypothetical protein